MNSSIQSSTKPSITIAIPVFNAEHTIELAIKSVLVQSFKDWELFIVNDGSIDKSMDICLRFQDPRIKIINDGLNRGLVTRLNSLPELARGKYLARMDADDVMHPERLAKQYAYLEAHPEVDVVDCGIFTINQQNRVTGKRKTEWPVLREVDLLKHCLFTHPAVMGKLEWFSRNRYKEEFYRAEDYELWIRAYGSSSYGRVPEPLLFYREGNVNVANYVNSMKSVRKIFRTYGPSLLSPATLRVELAKSYLKQYIYLIFGTFKLQSILAAKRNNGVEESEATAMMHVINDINNLKLL